MNYAKTPFLQNAMGKLLLILAISIVVKGELESETVSYDTEMKAYKFEPEVLSDQKGHFGWENRFNSCFQRKSPEWKSVLLPVINTRFNWKIWPNDFFSGTCFVKVLSKCCLEFNKNSQFWTKFYTSSLLSLYNATELKSDLQVYKCFYNLLERFQLHIGSGFPVGPPIICDILSSIW